MDQGLPIMADKLKSYRVPNFDAFRINGHKNKGVAVILWQRWKYQNSCDQCPMPIDATQNSGIPLDKLVMHVM